MRVGAEPRKAGGISPDPTTVHLRTAEERESVPAEGAVQSVQEAEVTIPRQRMETLWRAETLEQLARAYWAYVTRLFLSLVRVVYSADSTTVVLFSKRLPLLRFRAPEYEVEADGRGGSVTWPIDRGLLVAKAGRGRGQLRIRVMALEDPSPDPDFDKVLVRVAVRNFYPWLRGSGRFARFGVWLYSKTQLALHVIVCNGFLRSLSRLELPEPAVAPDAEPAERTR